jgi:hypothetical protein
MTPEQRSKRASNARTSRERTLLRELARVQAIVEAQKNQIAAGIDLAETAMKHRSNAIDEIAVLHRKNAELTMESKRYLSLADAWRDEAQNLLVKIVEERAKRRQAEKNDLPF